MKFQITLLLLCAYIVAIFATDSTLTSKEKRDKRQLLPVAYGGFGYPYYASAYPYGYAAAPYTAYSTYGALASPLAYPSIAAPVVTAPVAYFR